MAPQPLQPPSCTCAQLSRLRRLELQYNGFEWGPPAIVGDLPALEVWPLVGLLEACTAACARSLRLAAPPWPPQRLAAVLAPTAPARCACTLAGAQPEWQSVGVGRP